MALVVEPMELDDIPEVLEVDRECYTLPWPASAYRREILHNRNARYMVLRETEDGLTLESSDGTEESRVRLPLPFFRWGRAENRQPRDGSIIGYAGMWLMIDEAHITTIAVRETWRGHGLGELLLASLIQTAYDMNAEKVTLEVRVTNEAAQNLYRKYGFQQEGLRRRYYSDNNEDAFIMTTSNIRNLQYRQSFEMLADALRMRLQGADESEVKAPAFAYADRARQSPGAD